DDQTGLVISFGPGGSVVWDGTNQSGEAVQSGQYVVKVSRSGLGGSDTFSQSVTVLESPKGLLNAAVLRPNPLVALASTVGLMVSTRAGETLEATVFDLVGARVGEFTPGGSAGTLVWHVGGKAPGIYLVRAMARDAKGHRASRTFKLAILR